MKTKEREPKSTVNFYHDLFIGGYLDQKDFLEHHWNINKINEAVAVIKRYKESLEQNNLIEEI